MLHRRPQEDRNRETFQRGLKSLREYNIFTFQRKNKRMENPSLVAGIFRDQAYADQRNQLQPEYLARDPQLR